MSKREFLEALAERLASLSEFDREQSLKFYEEMIDDCMKGGASEEEVIALLDPVEVIAGEFLQSASKRTRRRWWHAFWEPRATAGRSFKASESIRSRRG